MTWNDLNIKMIGHLMEMSSRIKELAPKDSKYVSNDNGKLVDYIYVDGKRTRTNSNTLYNSIQFDLEYNGKNMIAKTVVKGDIPYYEKVVDRRTITVARHYRRSEYGSVRYGSSVIFEKDNRNYNYYVAGAKHEARRFRRRWNGKTFKITDNIEVFK